MKFLANENIPIQSVYFLKSKGYDISSIGLDNPSVKDEEVMAIAEIEERTILTFDRDYGELIFKRNFKPEKGVILFRIDDYRPIDPGKLIFELITNEGINFDRALTVINKNGIRQRKY